MLFQEREVNMATGNTVGHRKAIKQNPALSLTLEVLQWIWYCHRW